MPASAHPAEAPDRPGRATLAGLLACGMFPTVGLFSPGLVLPQIAREFAATPHVELLTELVGTVASFAFAVASPFAGMLVARFGCRRVIAPSLILFALFGAMPFVLHDLHLIVASRVLLGLALAGVFTGSLSGIGSLAPDLRIRMLGWYAAVGSATAIVMFPLIGMIGHVGWRPVFLLFLIALPVLPLVRAFPPALGIAARQKTAGGGRLFSLPMLAILLVAALVGMSMLIAPVYAPIHLSSLGITDTRTIAIPITLGSIGSVLTSAFYAPLHRRLGLGGISLVGLLLLGGALAACGLVSAFPLFAAALVVQSASFPLISSSLTAAALAATPAEKGAQAIGVTTGVTFGSQLLFPFIAAWIRGHAGLAAVFLLFGGAALVAAILLGGRMLRHGRMRAA